MTASRINVYFVHTTFLAHTHTHTHIHTHSYCNLLWPRCPVSNRTDPEVWRSHRRHGRHLWRSVLPNSSTSYVYREIVYSEASDAIHIHTHIRTHTHTHTHTYTYTHTHIHTHTHTLTHASHTYLCRKPPLL